MVTSNSTPLRTVDPAVSQPQGRQVRLRCCAYVSLEILAEITCDSPY